MSILCLGTWQFEKSFNKVTADEAMEVVKYAKEKGIKFFDTALAYGGGDVEKILSKVIDKNDTVITKIPAIKKPDINEETKIEDFYPIEYVKEKFELSSKNLGRHADVVLLHNWSMFWDEKDKAEELFLYFKKLKQEGFIKMFGISLPNSYGNNISNWLLDRVDFIEAPYNDLNNRWIENYITTIKERRLRLAIRSIFEKGNFFEKERSSLEVKNTILKASKLCDYLIIGITNKINIDKNLEILE